MSVGDESEESGSNGSEGGARPPRGNLSARARPMTITRLLVDIQRVQDWLAAGYQPRAASVRAQKELGLSRKQANRYVATAISILQGDDTLEPLESKRARIVAMLHAQIRGALESKRRYVSNGEEIEYDAPDHKAANQAIALLAKIEGVDKD